MTHTQKRLLLEAYRNGPQRLGFQHVAWRNLEKMGLVHIVDGRKSVAMLTKDGRKAAAEIEDHAKQEQAKKASEAQRQADFERRFAAKRVDA